MTTSRFVLTLLTAKGSEDALRPVLIKGKESRFVLLNPEVPLTLEQGRLKDTAGKSINVRGAFNLAADADFNQPLEDNLLLYGLFTYFYQTQDLRNNSSFDVSISKLSDFLGVSYGGTNDFKLYAKLASFQSVFGISSDKIQPLLELKRDGDLLHIRSLYMHELLLDILSSGQRYYYTELASLRLVSARNKIAALIVVELIRQYAKAGRCKQVKASLNSLIERVPQLKALSRDQQMSTSQKNRKLKRIFRSVEILLSEATELVDIEEIIVPVKDMSFANRKAVVSIVKKDTRS